MSKVGLIVEGGGFRGFFATGVLDFFMDNNIEFEYINAVSFGSVNACSYVSKQRGRTKEILDKYSRDPRYMGMKNWIKEGNYFGTDFVYNKVPNELMKWDLETFNNSKTIFNMVVTNCETGLAEYMEKSNIKPENLLDVVRASASLPMVSQIVSIDDKLYLDGGLADSIPIKKAIEDGYEKNVIVLTRDASYRKVPGRFKKLIRWKYRKYPELIKCIENRYKMYNETLEFINKLESEGKVFIIRPEEVLTVGRLEKDLEKLDSVYNHGIDIVQKKLDKMNEFINC